MCIPVVLNIVRTLIYTNKHKDRHKRNSDLWMENGNPWNTSCEDKETRWDDGDKKRLSARYGETLPSLECQRSLLIYYLIIDLLVATNDGRLVICYDVEHQREQGLQPTNTWYFWQQSRELEVKNWFPVVRSQISKRTSNF